MGCNAITQKYPTIEEYIVEWFHLMCAFPYLDLMIAVTNWNETPYWVWYEDLFETNWQYQDAYYRDKEFLDAIEIGICVSNGRLEILGKEHAVKQYRKYAKKYENPNKCIYGSRYYQDNHITQIDEVYLRRCISGYGVDADKILGNINRCIWAESK